MDLQKNKLGFGQRPALILVDMINGFTDPACPLGAECESVVVHNQQLLAAFRAKGLPVFFTTVVFHNESQARVFRDKINALDVLTPGSHWVKIDSRLTPLENEAVIEKQWASSFFKTDLAQQLIAAQADSIVVTGLTTSGCVRATVVDGLQHNFRVVVAEEAVGDRNQDAHKANLFDMNAKYADVTGCADIISQLHKI
ncbi:isochorismatase family protein [Thalassotalea psychrophila]|uniref:Isochorismatase family protein n=1 Tax=Thalassotalea psychrophila TaxID=3065647 RepID=A0ABY9TWQ2_9GAMM|nr:isochorismatase family protein [Colwelliaceae bacterium SQ149]